MKRIIISITISLLASITLFSCKPEQKVLFGIVTFTIGDVQSHNKKLEIDDIILKNRVITTGIDSVAVIQFRDIGLITIKENTTIKINQLQAKEGKISIDIHQSSGSTFSKLVKKGINYNLNTPTMLAAVRGTSFLVSVNEKGTEAKLLEGKILATPKIDNKLVAEKSIVLNKNEKVKVEENIISEPTKLTDEETNELSELNKIKMLEKPLSRDKTTQKKVISENSLKQLLDKENPAKTDEKANKKKKLTLKDLQKKYGSLSKITTKNGKSYIGSFKQKGGHMIVRTVSGKVKIKTTNIKKVSSYKL